MSQVKPKRSAIVTATITSRSQPAWPADEQLVAWAEAEIDNIRAAHTWSLEKAEFEQALGLVSSLQQLWVNRGRFLEGMARVRRRVRR